jgi:hypothetical protein
MTAGRNINTITKDWCTPKKYVDAIKEFFGGYVDLDPCSNQYSIVKARTEYQLPEKDGLKESWNYPTIYVNPPYGLNKERRTSIKDWIKLCAHAHQKHDSEVLALIPVAVNTRHWKEYIFGKANSICFLADTRLKFVINRDSSNKGAPMACAMVYWGKNSTKFYEIFSRFGAVVNITDLIEKQWRSPDINYVNSKLGCPITNDIMTDKPKGQTKLNLQTMVSKVLRKMEVLHGFIQIPVESLSELVGDTRLPCSTIVNDNPARLDKYGRLWSAYLKNRFSVGTAVDVKKTENGFYVAPSEDKQECLTSEIRQQTEVVPTSPYSESKTNSYSRARSFQFKKETRLTQFLEIT